MPAKFRLETAPVSGDPYFELLAADGSQRWSSRDKLFRVTDTLVGSVSYANRTTPLNGTTSQTLGSCSADATHVHGYVKLASVSLGAGQLSPFPAVGDWYYCSGTLVGFPSAGASDSLCAYTFLASGGSVTIEEQVTVYIIQNEFGQTFSFPAFTLDYELWIGTFA